MAYRPPYLGMEERLLAGSVLAPDCDCWIWVRNRYRGKRHDYYGRLTVRRNGRHQKVFAHREAYITFIGPIPPGYEVDHTCRNTLCINPAHLEAVTPTENNLRRTK